MRHGKLTGRNAADEGGDMDFYQLQQLDQRMRATRTGDVKRVRLDRATEPGRSD